MNLPTETEPGVKSGVRAERILAGGKLLAHIIRTAGPLDETAFVTTAEENLQVGFIVYPAGGQVAAHAHRPIERTITGTSEVVLVRSGRCELAIYGDDRQLVATRTLEPGDLVILVAGGHGFRMREDTVLLEVKQGPYGGLDEKERFE